MSKSWLLPLAVFAVVASPVFGSAHYRYVHQPQSDVYFGHISYCELEGDGLDPSVVRAEGSEAATVNLPLGPGDRILTTRERRCEAQFDSGTVMRLDHATGVRIETILAPALSTSDKLTNVELEAGRVHVLYRDYDTNEVFQLLTPNAAVKLERAAVVDVALAEDGETHVAVRRGKAAVLYGPRADRTRTRKLKAGERASVRADDTLVVTPAARDEAQDAFAAWNREMNDAFVERHAGRSALPKPILRYPRAVVEFAQRFADPYGEWIWSDLYGYAWRPYLGRDEGWRPFLQGRWVPVGGRLFWVPDEPWGWVPYHLGLWHWDTKHGWVWIPGGAFAPAWVTWSLCGEANYFHPLGLRDWGLLFSRGFAQSGNYGALWSSWPCDAYPGQRRSPTEPAIVASAPQPAASPAPADDGQTKPIRWRPDRPIPQLPEGVSSDWGRAVKRLRDGELPQRPGPQQTERIASHDGTKAPDAPANDVPQPGPARFRDWNDDVRAARGIGGRIVYSSETNSVACDDCKGRLLRREPGWGGGGSGSATSNSGSGDPGSAGGAAASAAGSGTAAPRGEGSDRERIRD